MLFKTPLAFQLNLEFLVECTLFSPTFITQISTFFCTSYTLRRFAGHDPDVNCSAPPPPNKKNVLDSLKKTTLVA